MKVTSRFGFLLLLFGLSSWFIACNPDSPQIDPQAPTAPSALEVSDKTPTGFKLSWTGSTDTDGSIVGYYISYRKGAADYRIEVSTDQLTYTFSGLVSETTYEVRVRAKDNEDYYSEYATLEVKTLAPGEPTVPSALEASDKTPTGFKLSWIGSTDTDGSIVGYYISYRKKCSGAYTTGV